MYLSYANLVSDILYTVYTAHGAIEFIQQVSYSLYLLLETCLQKCEQS